MRQALLLLADSRLPAGAHAHSGGIAPAVDAGLVEHDLALVADFLRGRLHTAGLLAAAIAARSCHLATAYSPAGAASGTGSTGAWAELDGEVDARTPAPEQRKVSRAQGRALLRVARRAFPHPGYDALGTHPHHPIALGVAVHAAGGTPEEAASVAVASAISGPASAAVRLLGLDPLALTAAHAALAPMADAVVADAARYADKPSDALPAPSAPLLDLLAQAHARSEVRLFAS
ncbi:urease accessory protein UreF [Cryptosporangium arvum]|uniref:Urease accessory protein UreF n=1 Tax=Cryptosporangium arvum DSM 44712 TaxID=927661 RepID=A0A010YIX8_9ACTN|nr:urease accessory UreF family protein [Cryptosporangium arvum]EXG80190.1 urease accessory protein UreF [Cryptosporangium arvum DSM 44712]